MWQWLNAGINMLLPLWYSQSMLAFAHVLCGRVLLAFFRTMPWPNSPSPNINPNPNPAYPTNPNAKTWPKP